MSPCVTVYMCVTSLLLAICFGQKYGGVGNWFKMYGMVL